MSIGFRSQGFRHLTIIFDYLKMRRFILNVIPLRSKFVHQDIVYKLSEKKKKIYFLTHSCNENVLFRALEIISKTFKQCKSNVRKY